MPKSTPIAPEQIKFSELVIDETLSGRSSKEIRDNAKSLAPEMQAFGAWDEKQPGQYFEGEDGKLYVCAGFTRIAAAQLSGFKHGYFFRDESDVVTRRLKCITTNGGKPVSRYEQGRVYLALEQGVVADDFTGSIAEPANPAHWKVAPMSIQEIADKIGKTAEHIRQCIATFTLPEPIAELLETEQISTNPALKAMQWAKDDEALALRICKAAVREAGGEKATQKHFDAIKADYVKQKAVSKADSTTDGQPEPEKPAAAKSDARNGDAGKAEQDTKEEYEPELMLPVSTPASKPPTKKEAKTIRESALTVILETDSEIDDDLATRLVDRLTDAGLLAAHLPF